MKTENGEGGVCSASGMRVETAGKPLKGRVWYSEERPKLGIKVWGMTVEATRVVVDDGRSHKSSREHPGECISRSWMRVTDRLQGFKPEQLW